MDNGIPSHRTLHAQVVTESTDPANGPATFGTYIAHHNGPQYFGYEANNPLETKTHLKGLGD